MQIGFVLFQNAAHAEKFIEIRSQRSKPPCSLLILRPTGRTRWLTHTDGTIINDNDNPH